MKLVVSYLLFLPAFIWWIFLEKKNSADCLLKKKWLMKTQFSRQITMFSFRKYQLLFISHFVFRRQLSFSYPKKTVKWKQIKIPNIILQILQVLYRIAHLYVDIFYPEVAKKNLFEPSTFPTHLGHVVYEWPQNGYWWEWVLIFWHAALSSYLLCPGQSFQGALH